MPKRIRVKTILSRCLVVTFVLLSGCEVPNEGEKKDRHVDTVYVNGAIWTGVDKAPDASILAVKDGRIFFIGDVLPKHIASDSTIDLAGRFVMPGFMDNHVHFMEGGAALASIDLRSTKSSADFIKQIKNFTKDPNNQEWVLNGNWDQTKWGGELPHRDWIDSFTKERPVYLIRSDGHMALANSAALSAAGISNQTPNPAGGEIARDESGRATGILKGNALNLVLAVIPPPSDDVLMHQFSLAQERALSLGLTKVHALTAYPTETNMLEIFKLARQRGLMKIRAQVSTPIESWQSMKTDVLEHGRGDEQLKWGGVKGFIDGSLGARTAWMYDEYSDAPNQTGLPLNKLSDLRDWMQKADSNQLELSIHAIGDKGIDSVIDVMQGLAGEQIRDRRYRIEHFQHPTKEAISQIAKQGIIASMQPYHAIDDGRWAERRIGAERLPTTYAFRSIIEAGGIVTFGSDWPVAPLSPIQGVYAAVTRRTLDDKNPDGWIPEQKIDVETALTAYTKNNAYAFHEEDVAGTLEANKRADFVILTADPRAVAPEKIPDIQVIQTVISGNVVYDSN